jgi:hypothetical protein
MEKVCQKPCRLALVRWIVRDQGSCVSFLLHLLHGLQPALFCTLQPIARIDHRMLMHHLANADRTVITNTEQGGHEGSP